LNKVRVTISKVLFSEFDS